MKKKPKGPTLLAKINDHSMVKPSELIEVTEAHPLTLHDRLMLNQMIAAAWDQLGERAIHRIEKRELKNIDKNTDRLQSSIERLISTSVKLIRQTDEGEQFVRTFSFLSRVDNSLANEGGWIRFRFSEDAEELMLNSNVFARLQKEMMFALSSRYSLALFELLSQRKNLTFKNEELFELDHFRQLLGVPEGTYPKMNKFRSRVLDVAFGEVNQLTDIGCAFQLIRKGRSFGSIRIGWWGKDSHAKWDAEKARELPKIQQLAQRSEVVETLKGAEKLGARR